ncbi:MAG TPA: hypothetical protein VGB63_15650 [Pedobacter sp.]|jgi:hypothetical protein
MKKYLFVVFIYMVGSCTTGRHPITYTKTWKGSDYPGHSEGQFENLNGEASFKLKSPLTSKFFLKYSIESTSSGELSLVLRSGKVIHYNRSISSKVADSIVFDNKGDKPYELAIIGKKAAGRFVVDYGSVSR